MLRSQSTVKERGLDETTLISRVTAPTFVLGQYSKAIKATLNTIKEGSGGADLATVTCSLFVCIEALQGHEAEAISLFRSGRQALELERSAKALEDTAWRIFPTSAHLSIRQVFDSFSQQIVLVDTTSIAPSEVYKRAYIAALPRLSTCLSSLEESQERLLSLFSFVQSVAAVGGELKWDQTKSSVDPDIVKLRARQIDLDCALQHWHLQYLSLVEDQRHKCRLSVLQQAGILTLLQQYRIIKIWLAGSLEVSECFYDQFRPQFQVIVDAVTSLTGLNMQAADKQTFCLDMGSIPPLYWTSIKCREPRLRRQALSLLTREPRREGLWDSRVVSKVARRVIQLEEASDDNTASLPPEERRTSNVRIKLNTTAAGGQQEDFVEFYSLPEGLTRTWHVRKEFVALLA